MTLEDRIQRAAADTNQRMSHLDLPPLRNRHPRLKAALGIASLLVLAVGGAAMLRSAAPTDTSFIAEPPTSVADPSAASSGHVVASFVPEGMELLIHETNPVLEDGVALYVPTGAGVITDTGPFLARHSYRDLRGDGYTLDQVVEAFNASGFVDVERATVRGRPAALGIGPTGAIALLVLEDSALVTEISARGIGIEDVRAFAEGVIFVARDSFEEEPPEQFGWDLRAQGVAADGPDTIRRRLADVPGTADVRLALGSELLGGPAIYRSLLSLASSDGSPATAAEIEPGVALRPPATSDTEPAALPRYAAFVSLADGADPEKVAAQYHDMGLRVSFAPEIADKLRQRLEATVAAAAVLHTEPLIVQAPASPAPRFDTSELGIEEPLLPARPGDEIDVPSMRAYGRLAGYTDADQTVVYLGTLDNGTRLLLQILDVDFFFETVRNADGGGGSAGGSFADFGYGVSGGSSGGGRSTVNVRIPLETAVVVLDTGEGRLWQRPVLGYGLFRIAEAVGPLEVIALDADGEELGRWTGSL